MIIQIYEIEKDYFNDYVLMYPVSNGENATVKDWQSLYGYSITVKKTDIFDVMKLRKGLYVPKIFKKEKIIKTKSWYTEYGYQKYKNAIEAALEGANSYPYKRGLKLITTETVGKIISKGKVQIVTLIE